MFTSATCSRAVNQVPERTMRQLTRDKELLQEALHAFQRSTGLNASLARAKSAGSDVLLEVSGSRGTSRFVAQVRHKVDRAAVALSALKGPSIRTAKPVLIAPHVSAAMAHVCREHDLAFMDCAGNAFLNAPGTLVFVVGNKPAKSGGVRQPTRRTFGESGLRIIYNCLLDPTVLQATYREIARASGTALGTVSGILSELREQGLLTEDKTGRRHWVDRERVIDAWLVNFPLALRPKLAPRRFRARNDSWWEQVDPIPFGMQWGAEIAAARLTGELEPRTVTLYTHQPPGKFVAAHRLVADPEGPVEILSAFWPPPVAKAAAAELVGPLLICADLVSIADPRTIQAARTIRKKSLA
jgi:hypothetical protein